MFDNFRYQQDKCVQLVQLLMHYCQDYTIYNLLLRLKFQVQNKHIVHVFAYL